MIRQTVMFANGHGGGVDVEAGSGFIVGRALRLDRSSGLTRESGSYDGW